MPRHRLGLHVLLFVVYQKVALGLSYGKIRRELATYFGLTLSLGHSSPSITAAIYAHALDESKSEAIAGLSKRLKRPKPHNSQHNSQPPENDDGPSAEEGPSTAS